jgi:hypothetical protein
LPSYCLATSMVHHGRRQDMARLQNRSSLSKSHENLLTRMHKEMFKPMRLYDVAFGEEPQSLASLIRRGINRGFVQKVSIRLVDPAVVDSHFLLVAGIPLSSV